MSFWQIDLDIVPLCISIDGDMPGDEALESGRSICAGGVIRRRRPLDLLLPNREIDRIIATTKRPTENELNDFNRLWLVVVGNHDWTERWPGTRRLD